MRLKTDMYTDMRNEIWYDINEYYKNSTPSYFTPDLKEVIVTSLCKAKLLLRIIGDLIYTSWYNGSKQCVNECFTKELNNIFDLNTIIGSRRLIDFGLCPHVYISDIREQLDKSVISITLSYVFLKNDAIVAAPLNLTINILTKDTGYYDFESDKFITMNNKLSIKYRLYLNECNESIDLSNWNNDNSIESECVTEVLKSLYEYLYNPVTKILITTVLLNICSHDSGYLNFCRNCQNEFDRRARCITAFNDIINKLLDNNDIASGKHTITIELGKMSYDIFKHVDDCIDPDGVVASAVPGIENSSWSLPNSLLDFMIFERFNNYYYYSPTSTLNYISKMDTKVTPKVYIRDKMHYDPVVDQNVIFDDIDVLFGLKNTTIESSLKDDNDNNMPEEVVVDIDESFEQPNEVNIVTMAKQAVGVDEKKRVKTIVKIKKHKNISNEKSFPESSKNIRNL